MTEDFKIPNPYEALIKEQWKPNERVESGAIQFGDDWPGVFIRGDEAIAGFLPAVQKAAQGEDLNMIDRAQLRGLADLIVSAHIKEGPHRKLAHPALTRQILEMNIKVKEYLTASYHRLKGAMAIATEIDLASRAVVSAYDREHPVRQADVHPDACPCLRCAVDAVRKGIGMETPS